MTFKPLLLAASALAIVAFPMSSFAQDHGHGGGGGGGHGGGAAPHGGGGGGHGGGGGGMPHMGGGGGGHMGGGGAMPHTGGSGGHMGGGMAHVRTGGGGGGGHATFRSGGASAHVRTGGGAATHVRTGGGAVRSGAVHGGTTFARGGRTGGTVTGHAVGGRTGVRQSAAVHTQLRNSWSANRSVVATHAVWRGNRNWWRGNAHFNGYTGARSGYYFAPGFGYYSVPREYWGHRWGIGAFLPLFFLTYTLADYGDYGCPPPPPGCAWVWVGPNLLLIDVADGYVIDEYYNVF